MRVRPITRQAQRSHDATPAGLAKRCKRDRKRSACRQLARAVAVR